MQPQVERGVDVARLPHEAGRRALVADGGVLVDVGGVGRVVEEERGPLVGEQHEVVGGRVAGDVDAGRPDGHERVRPRPAQHGLDGEPPSEPCAHERDRPVGGERIDQVRDEIGVVVDGVGAVVGAGGAAVPGELGGDDLAGLGEQVEEGRPPRIKLVVEVEEAGPVAGAQRGKGERGEGDVEGARRHRAGV